MLYLTILVEEFQKHIKDRELHIVVTPVKKPWAGELDYEHPKIESITKAIHKRFKDLELPEQFNYSALNKKDALRSEPSLGEYMLHRHNPHIALTKEIR